MMSSKLGENSPSYKGDIPLDLTYGHKIRVYEPANDDKIPEEEHSLSDDADKIQSPGIKKIKARPNLFQKKTSDMKSNSALVFKSEAQEPIGDDGNDILSDNNGEVTEFVGSYEQV